MKRLFIILLIFFLTLLTLTSGSTAQTPPRAAYWPTREWRSSTPEEQGLDSTKLADALSAIRERNINIHSLLLVRNGYVVLDAYFYPFEENGLHDLASVTKSVTSTLIGIAIDEHKIPSLRTPVLELFPGRAIASKDVRKERMKLEDLLTMTSGVDCHPEDNERTLHQMMSSSDWVQFMLDLPMANEPGEHFTYCSGGMHLLSGILSETTGTDALAFARRTLFEPLGIHDEIWPFDSKGNNHGWGDLHLRPRDVAKIGYLLLNHGVWEGKQIVSTQWVDNATRVHAHTSLNSDYGYGWWVRPKDKLYEAVGRGGQRVTVLPELNLIVVMMGGGFDPAEVGALLLPAIKSDRPLSPNANGVAKLSMQLKRAAEPPAGVPVATLPKTAGEISNKVFELDQNPLLTKMSLMFPSKGEGSVTLTFNDGHTEVHTVGLDGVAHRSPNGRYGLPVALKGSWVDEKTFALDYDEVGNINHLLFKMTFREEVMDCVLSELTQNLEIHFAGHLVN
jgi:CubicO group peptidase (beta-lactamase class C family)